MNTITYTFRNGITVGVLRMSPDLLREIQRQFPPPSPPVQHTELGDEPNPADPDYLIAAMEHRQQMGDRLINAIILRGLWVDIDKPALEQLRADMREVGTELPANDKIAYVRYLCITDPGNELRELQEIVLRQGQPTEAAIREAAGEFKSDVPGPGRVFDSSAA